MIGHLKGCLAWKQPQEVLVDVGGVGYRVAIPLTTFYKLGEPGAEVSLRVHTHVREDALQLYGFLTVGEEALFARLIGVAGIGPRLALNILSGIEAVELTAALRQGDLARLTRIPGVGKKTAERLVLELRDKLSSLADAGNLEPTPTSRTLRDDLLSALVHLGYSRGEAEKGVEGALREDGSGRFEDLLRRSLQLLSGR